MKAYVIKRVKSGKYFKQFNEGYSRTLVKDINKATIFNTISSAIMHCVPKKDVIEEIIISMTPCRTIHIN